MRDFGRVLESFRGFGRVWERFWGFWESLREFGRFWGSFGLKTYAYLYYKGAIKLIVSKIRLITVAKYLSLFDSWPLRTYTTIIYVENPVS